MTEESRHREAAAHSHEEIHQIIDILEGPAIPQLGGPPERRGGLVDQVAEITTTVDSTQKKVEQIEKRLSNGGIRINLPTWTKWAAFILTVINILVGIRLVVG